MYCVTSESGLAPQAVRDLQAAADSGRLGIDDPQAAVVMAGGALLGALQQVRIRPGLDAEHVTDQLAARLLRLFGLPAQKHRRSPPASAHPASGLTGRAW